MKKNIINKQIIISITGIVMVILILLGITYAYFVTNIKGNDNEKSIDATTAYLELVYGDGNGLISAHGIMPNTTVKAKTFTVTNTGTTTVNGYAVVLENVINTFKNKDDIVYTLSCKSSIANKTCLGTYFDTNFPSSKSILIDNSIESEEIQTYELSITYLDSGEDQSIDMNAIVSGKIQIYDLNNMNPYATIEDGKELSNNSLAYNIVNNAREGLNGTKFVKTPPTEVAKEPSGIIFKKIDTPVAFSSTENATNIYYTYADDYSVDPKTGKFTLVNPSESTKYSDIPSIKGKYFVSSGKTSKTSEKTSDLDHIYLVSKYDSDITSSSFKYTFIGRKDLIKESTESVLSVTQDDFGTSYYYRGLVKNNYLNYNNMCWRVVRIEGDGSVKIILTDSDAPCSTQTISKTSGSSIGTGDFGYIKTDGSPFEKYKSDYLNSNNSVTTIKYKLDQFLNGGTIGTKTYSGLDKTKLKNETWCLGDRETTYDVDTGEKITVEKNNTALDILYDQGRKIYIPTKESASMQCNGDEFTSMIGALTTDEVMFAGAYSALGEDDLQASLVYYLGQNVSGYFLTLSTTIMSFGGWDAVEAYSENDRNAFDVNDENPDIRPVVTLKSGIEISSGNGTIDNPYEVA